MFNLKNLKVVREFENVAGKLRWSMSMFSDAKANSDYFDLICGEKENNVEETELYLQKMVRESLVKEFCIIRFVGRYGSLQPQEKTIRRNGRRRSISRLPD